MIFDEVLEDKLGHGFFQIKQLVSLAFIDFIDGIEGVFIGILLSIIKFEWNLTNSQVILLGSAYMFGNFIGGLICAYFADIFGRRTTLIYATFIQIFVLYSTSKANTFLSMFILRLIYGLLFDLTMPLSSILLSETTPKELRGRYLVWLHFFY
jgi:MFS family permease